MKANNATKKVLELGAGHGWDTLTYGQLQEYMLVLLEKGLIEKYQKVLQEK